MAGREIRIPIIGDSSQLRRELAKAEGELTGFGSKATGFATKFHREFLGVGLAITAGIGLAVKSAMDFEQQLSEVGAVSGSTGKELDKLRQAALDAGAATIFNAKESAKAEAELAKAGLSTADILGGALTGALDLAAAGSIGVGDAAEIAAKSMVTFGLAGSDVPQIADALAAGANKAVTEVGALGEGLGEVGGTATQFGLSIQDTIGTLSLFSQYGQDGAEAGTALKTVLLRLGAPTNTAAQAMKELGLNFYDANGQFVGLADASTQLKEKLGPLADEQRNAALQTIFGARAIKGATILMQEGGQGVSDWSAAVNESGYAADIAAQKTDNLAGDLEQLRGSIETALIQGGSQATDALRGVAQSMTLLVNGIGEMPGPLQVGFLGATGLIGVGSTAIGIFGTLAPKVNAAKDALMGMGAAGQFVGRNLGTIGASAAGLGAALGVISIAMGQAAKRQEEFDAQVETFLSAMKEANGVTGDFNDTIKESIASNKLGEILSDTSINVDVFTNGIRNSGTELDEWAKLAESGSSGIEVMLRSMRDAQGAGDTFANELLKAYDAGDLTVSQLVDLVRGSDNLNDSVDTAAQKLGVEQKILDAVGGSAGDAAGATDGLTGATNDAAAAFDDAQQQIDDAVSALKDWYDQTTSQLSAQVKFESSIDDITASVAEHGTTLDIDTEAGRANIDALIAGKDAVIDYGVEILNATGSTTEATAATKMMVQKLKDTMRQAGFTEDQVNDYIETLGLTPDNIDTQFNVYGVEEGQQRIDSFIYTNSNRTIPIEVVARVNAAQLAAIQMYGGADGDPSTPRAMGGFVDPNRPRLVGERGPEMFWPSAYGSVINASKTAALFKKTGGASTNITIQNLNLNGVQDPEGLVDALQRYVRLNGPLPV